MNHLIEFLLQSNSGIVGNVGNAAGNVASGVSNTASNVVGAGRGKNFFWLFLIAIVNMKIDGLTIRGHFHWYL